MSGKRMLLWPERFCIGAVRMITGLILIFLTTCSILITCTVYGGNEIIEYGADQPLLHLMIFFAVLAVGVLMKRKEIHPLRAVGKPDNIPRLLLLFMGICFIWLLLTWFYPGADQRMALESAEALLEGNFSPWAPWGFGYSPSDGITGYAFTYPSQNGLILFFALVSLVFRGLTPYVLQVMNIAFLVMGVLYLHRLTEGVFSVRRMSGTYLLLLCYLPFLFYITFVYGTIPGFAFSSMAIYYEHRFLKTGKWKNFFIAAAAICGAILLKSNYLIILVAMVIYLLTWGVFRKKAGFFAAAVLLVLLYIGSGKLMNLGISTITGEPVSKGAPMLGWVEMGLQEGERAPGWYNGYNIHVFSDNELDPDRALLAVKQDLQETLQGFLEEPERAKDFFLMKTASIWAEPTFQSLWIQEIKGNSWLFPAMTASLFQEDGILNRIYVTFFNYIQTLVYVGALLFFLLRRGRITWEQLMPAVIFIGGFLFHIVWEAKGQYTVCYFILLIPYAYLGLKEAVDRLYKICYSL